MSLGDYVRDRRRRRAADRAAARRKPETAFVLSGGGVLGAVQVGQLHALIERGILPDVVVAASVGALNGAQIAAEPTPESVERMAHTWMRLRSDDLFPGSRVAKAWNIVSRGDHIYPNDGIRRLVERVPVRTFEECAVSFHTCATNLRTGEECWFSSGPLMPAILASTALPGIFPPVAIDGERYVDGGVVNNVPISRAIDLGARKIYVLTCSAPQRDSRPIHRPLDVLVQAFAHSRAARVSLDHERFAGRAEIVLMPTFDPGFIRYDDPSQSERLISRARELSQRFLDGQRALEA